MAYSNHRCMKTRVPVELTNLHVRKTRRISPKGNKDLLRDSRSCDVE